MSKSKPARVLYWFRTDLRLSDSPALHAAIHLPDIQAFYPVWTFDPTYIYGHRVGTNRLSFLLESMHDLSAHLTALNPRQKLHVLRGKPGEVMPRLWESWGITHLAFEKDSNAYSRVRDGEMRKMAEAAGVEMVEVGGRHLYDPAEVVEANGGKPTLTLHHWQAVSLADLVTKEVEDV